MIDLPHDKTTNKSRAPVRAMRTVWHLSNILQTDLKSLGDVNIKLTTFPSQSISWQLFKAGLTHNHYTTIGIPTVDMNQPTTPGQREIFLDLKGIPTHVVALQKGEMAAVTPGIHCISI